MLKHAIFALVLLGTLSVKSATMVYVSPKGADMNPGTQEKPFGGMAYLPGGQPSHSRIDIQLDSKMR